ncbi:unnamed protein product [Heligmosomoides polygyrus]|uniref:HTH CENPB-type domain-containing protein n=1 Tax=Heligmosomoides polygyrus TaxID=6339 RepID=A0A183F7H8_HELPZ|nr:unnamed protein product [Heligmosomoides polygyrus]
MPSARSGKGLALGSYYYSVANSVAATIRKQSNLTKHTLRLATLTVVDDRDRGLPAGDEAAFNNRLAEVLTYLRNKERLQMVQYLQKEHLRQEKIKKWASLNRRGAVMSTSMFGERWYLRLKREKLKRKANARADFVIDVLIKAVNKLTEDYEVALGHVVAQLRIMYHKWMYRIDDNFRLHSAFEKTTYNIVSL